MTALAYILAFLKYVIYGTSVFFTGSLTDSVDVLDVLALRFLMSFAVLFVLKITRAVKINVGVRDIFGRTERSPYIGSIVLAALFEPVLYMLFETLGISMTTDVTTGVVLSLLPVSSVICESVLLKEKTTALQKIFLALGVAGVIYISVCTDTSDGTNSVIGIIFLVLAVLCGSLFQVFSRKSAPHFTAMEITYFSCMLGALAFNAANAVRHLARGDILHYFDPYFDLDNLIGFLFLAVASTIIATCMSNFSLGRMQITTMSAFAGISTVTTILVGVLVSHEPLYHFHYIGISLIVIRMIGVSAIAIRKDRLRALKPPSG